MKVYFPQWQGSGTGKTIELGAKTVLEYLDDPEFINISLSKIPAGELGVQKFHINNYDALTEQLTRFKKEIDNLQPLSINTIGGDCGLEIVPVSYLNQKYPNLGVIWFDAHADINRPCDSPSCNFHGMPLRTLLGEGEKQMDTLLFSKIKASQIHYVGLRDIDQTEKERIDAGPIYAPAKLNISELINTLTSKHITHIYLHFDFDCLDPEDYDKTYYKISNGLKIKEAKSCIAELKKNFVVVGNSALESITPSLSELKPIEPLIDLLLKE